VPTTRGGRLRGIEHYAASLILFTRFDYTTGNAAGQNLTGNDAASAAASSHALHSDRVTPVWCILTATDPS
jgi:hydroxymethylglutaryl-CoA reductase